MAQKTNEEKLAEALALEPVSYSALKPTKIVTTARKNIYVKVNFYDENDKNITFQQFAFHGEGAEKEWEEFEEKRISSILEKKEVRTFKSADETITNNKEYVSGLNKDKQPGEKGTFDQYSILSEKGGNTVESTGRITISIVFSSSSSNIILPAKKMIFPDENALTDFKKFLKTEKFKSVPGIKRTSGGRNHQAY